MAILGNPSYDELENGASSWSLPRDTHRRKIRDWLYGWGFLWLVWIVISTICFAFLFGYVKMLQNDMRNVMMSQHGIENIVQNELFHYMRSFDEHYLAKIKGLNRSAADYFNDTSEEDDDMGLEGLKDLHQHNDTHDKTIFGPPGRFKRDVIPSDNHDNVVHAANSDNAGARAWPRALSPLPYRQTYRDSRRMRSQERSTPFFGEDQNRRERLSRGQVAISVHYNGDTNDYNIDRHPHYKVRSTVFGATDCYKLHDCGNSSSFLSWIALFFLGNGHIRHLHKKYKDWAPAGWVMDLEMDEYFNLTDGDLTVKQGGLYLIYVQIYYLDVHDRNAYRVYLNDNVLLQCTITIHNIDGRENGNTCYTSSVVRLSSNDVIYIADVNDNRYSIFDTGRSFFGLVQLGEA